MMCDECGIRPATIRLMTIVNGEKKQRNLCVNCLSEVKKQFPSLDISGINSLLSGLLLAAKQTGAASEPEIDITCPRCGTTYESFQKSGLLGCADCYKAFKEPLEALLKRVHGQTQHTGRVPGGLQGDLSVKMNIDRLRQQLKEAISAEEYERAAQLRDQIRALSAKIEPRAEAPAREEAQES